MQAVTLTTPLHDKQSGRSIDTVEFRDPNFDDYFEFGDPRAPILRGEKTYYVPMPESIKLYVDRLVVGVKPELLATASLVDAKKFEKAILQQFRDAEADKGGAEWSGTVSLSKPLTTPRGPIDSLQFREPRLEDYLLLGDPRTHVSAGNDRFFMMSIPSVVRVYAERLVISADGFHAMSMAPLPDLLKIEQVILGFFEVADQAMTSGASPAISPS